MHLTAWILPHSPPPPHTHDDQPQPAALVLRRRGEAGDADLDADADADADAGATFLNIPLTAAFATCPATKSGCPPRETTEPAEASAPPDSSARAAAELPRRFAMYRGVWPSDVLHRRLGNVVRYYYL